MSLIEVKSVKITSKGQIALPKDIRSIEGFKEGSKIAILTFKDRIELRPMNKIRKYKLTMLASEKTLAKDWNSEEEDKAWKNL